MFYWHVKILVLLIGILSCKVSIAQSSVFIDEKGIMRWTETEHEVCNFGTNYAVPFSYWEWHQAIGADLHQAIREDVYHMARLGLDGYRIHLWESYITDTLGNLIYNEHFELFDYLLFQLQQRGIKSVITCNILNSSGGFVNRYGNKTNCISNKDCWDKQSTYLKQLVSHTNPYTGIAYKNDPDIIAFAITNEPKHSKAPHLTTEYINTMYDAIRSAGCEKPVFYNMTTSADQIEHIVASEIDGGTFQWYPTGLTANHIQKGNVLPNVDEYVIPFSNLLNRKKLPRIIYEFSPSDVQQAAMMYPAMARSFREAGFQFAAHFAYDPLHAAYCNIEYRTHFLNLVYTPQKAIGLMIASEVFHSVPLGNSYGRYPENNHFEDFTLNYIENNVEMVTQTKFLYSNNSNSEPPDIKKLEKIVGTGNSTVVHYKGTGAYFLDKLEDGIWRLEVFPDAFIVADPFFVPYLEKEVAVINRRHQEMIINLPDLGNDFIVSGLNVNNNTSFKTSNKKFSILPGCYLLVRKGVESHYNPDDKWQNIQLNEYYIPTRELNRTYVLHKPPTETSILKPCSINAQVIAPYRPTNVEVIVLTEGGGDIIQMQQTASYSYTAEIPVIYTQREQVINYYISVQKNDTYLLYPGNEEGNHLLSRRIYKNDVQLDDVTPYQIRVVDEDKPICLFDANRDWHNITKMDRKDVINCYPSEIPGKSLIKLNASNLMEGEHNYSIRMYCRNNIEERPEDILKKRNLVLYGQSLPGSSGLVQVSLLLRDGTAYGAMVELDDEFNSYSIRLDILEQVQSVLLPRPYPKFHKYWFKPAVASDFSIHEVESIQLSIGPGIQPGEYNKSHGISIGWIALE